MSRLPRVALGRAQLAGSAALLAALLLARSASAQFAPGPEPATSNGVSLVFQLHSTGLTTPLVWTGPFFGVAVPSESQSTLRIDSFHFVPNVGDLRGSFDIAPQPGAFEATRGRVQLADARVGAWAVALDAGDTPASPYTLDLHLSSLFTPSAGVRGVQASAARGGVQYLVFAGQATASTGMFGERVLTSPQSIAGGRATFSPKDRLTVAAGVARSSIDGPFIQPLPATSVQGTVDATFQWSKALRLVAETAVSHSADAIGPRAEATTGSYIAGGTFQDDRGRGEFSLLRLATAYTPTAYFTLGDRAGLYASADRQVLDSLQLFGGFDRWHNNVDELPLHDTLSVRQGFGGFRWHMPGDAFLTIRAGGATLGSGASLDLVTANNRNISADVSRQFGQWNLLGRGEQMRTTQFAVFTELTERSRAELVVRRMWPRGSMAWGSAGAQSEQTGAETGRTMGTGSAGVSLNVSPASSVQAEGTWNQTSVALRTSRADNVAFMAGLNTSVRGGLRVSLNGRYSRESTVLSAFDTLALDPDNVAAIQNLLIAQHQNRYQLMVRVQKDFAWGLRPAKLTSSPSTAPLPREFGGIEGMVFDDINRDGMLTPGEKSVGHSVVIVDGTTKVGVDATGRFGLKTIAVGRHTVQLDPTSVPAAYDMGPGAAATVDVVKRGTARLEFPLVHLGRIGGRISVVDRTVSDNLVAAAAPSGDPPTAKILVVLNDGAKVTMTDEDGDFEFTSLPPGEYRVRVDTASLPQFWTLQSAEAVDVALEPGGRVSTVTFVVNANPRGTRRVFAAVQQLDTPATDAPKAPASPEQPTKSSSRKRPAAKKKASSRPAPPQKPIPVSP